MSSFGHHQRVHATDRMEGQATPAFTEVTRLFAKDKDSPMYNSSAPAFTTRALVLPSTMSPEPCSQVDSSTRQSICNTSTTTKTSSTLPSRIAFGSCNDQGRQNNLWPIIESRNPVAFVWGGDAIYADIEHPADFSTWPPTPPRVECASAERVRSLYRHQRAVPGYASLISSNVTIFGTIDDHDYGCDNADKYYPHKHDTTNAFLEFLGEPEDSSMAKRAAAGHGVYGVKLFDFDRPEGEQLVPESEACIDPDFLASISSSSSSGSKCTPTYSNKTVAVFALDVRTNKDPWKDGSDAYFAKDYDGDFLGERQWRWFEEAISHSQAAVNVVVNGLQVNSKIFPNPNVAENWSSFPRSQQRLYDAMLGPSVQAPLLISGDVHMTQMMRKDCRKRVTDDNSSQDLHLRPVIELTTSGMTHSWGSVSTPHLANLGDDHQGTGTATLHERLRSMIAGIAMHTMHQLLPWNSLAYSSRIPSLTNNDRSIQDQSDERAIATHDGGIENAKQGLQYSLDRNFGELEFDWVERTVTIRAIGEDETAPPLLAAKVRMDQLSGKVPMDTSWVSNSHFERESSTNPRYDILDGDWVCIEHRGPVSSIDEMIGHASVIAALGTIFVLPAILSAFCLGYLWRRRKRSASPSSLGRCSNNRPMLVAAFSRSTLPRMVFSTDVDDHEKPALIRTVSSMDSFFDKMPR